MIPEEQLATIIRHNAGAAMVSVCLYGCATTRQELRLMGDETACLPDMKAVH